MRKSRTPVTAWSRRNRYRRVGAVALVIVVCSGGWLLAKQTSPMRTDSRVYRTQDSVAATDSFSSGNPSKEYIYAGSRLLAIEEAPAGGAALAAPRNLEATGVGAPTLAEHANGDTRVVIRWEATPGAHHYQLERAFVVGGSGPEFRLVYDNIPSNGATDGDVAEGMAFLYRVRAVDAGGRPSEPSNFDLATLVGFSDDPLAGRAATSAGTIIRARHLNELRRAADAVRRLVGLAPATYTHSAPSPGGASSRRIFLSDVRELRGALDEALGVLGMQRPYVTDPSLTTGTYVKAAHFQEIRDRVR